MEGQTGIFIHALFPGGAPKAWGICGGVYSAAV